MAMLTDQSPVYLFDTGNTIRIDFQDDRVSIDVTPSNFICEKDDTVIIVKADRSQVVAKMIGYATPGPELITLFFSV